MTNDGIVHFSGHEVPGDGVIIAARGSTLIDYASIRVSSLYIIKIFTEGRDFKHVSSN